MERITRQGLALGAAIVLAGAGFAMFAELNRPVTDLKIEGSLTAAERSLLRTVLEPYADARILTVDLGAIVESVSALGWPRGVTVKRRWPDSLVLRLKRQDVQAIWNERRYLTANGLIIDQADSLGELPHLYVEAVAPETALAALARLSELARSDSVRIDELHHSLHEGWWLLQNDGLRVMLGQDQPLGRLLARYRRVLGIRAQLDPAHSAALEYADARYRSGVALRSKDQLATADPVPAPLLEVGN